MKINKLHPRSIYKKIRERQQAATSSSKELKYKGHIAEKYLKERAHRQDWHEEQLIFGFLMSKLEDGISVADIPFGTGRFLPIYLAKKFSVLGVDISEEMIQFSKVYNAPDFVGFETCLCDATKLSLDTESVDLVVSYRFLGYILTVERAKQAISEFVRVARSNLILQLQFLKDDSPAGAKDKLGHRETWSQQQEFLEGLGLKILERIDLPTKEAYCNTVVFAEKVLSR